MAGFISGNHLRQPAIHCFSVWELILTFEKNLFGWELGRHGWVRPTRKAKHYGHQWNCVFRQAQFLFQVFCVQKAAAPGLRQHHRRYPQGFRGNVHVHRRERSIHYSDRIFHEWAIRKNIQYLPITIGVSDDNHCPAAVEWNGPAEYLMPQAGIEHSERPGLQNSP